MAETKTPLTTQQKIGLALGGLAALGGIAIAASGLVGDDEKKPPQKIDNPFASIKRRLGRKGCGGCGLGDKGEE